MKNLTASVAALACLMFASVATAAPLSAQQATQVTQITSQRWLGEPASHVSCDPVSRGYVCSLTAYGAVSGELEHISCASTCAIVTRMHGLWVRRIPGFVLVSARRHHWGVTTTIAYRTHSRRGIVSGQG